MLENDPRIHLTGVRAINARPRCCVNRHLYDEYIYHRKLQLQMMSLFMNRAQRYIVDLQADLKLNMEIKLR